MLILGLESSCDDSCAAIIDEKRNILSNIVISQDSEHHIYNGVVPEIAARAHADNMEIAINRALSEANLDLKHIDVIACTAGPGLIGGVLVCSMFAKTLASILKKPLIAVNHLEGHALTIRLTHGLNYPYLLLIASGGHSQFVMINGLADYKILGTTQDDAIGECFDKVAKMLGLPFPGGKWIEKYALDGDENRFDLPKPMLRSKDCNMSFSGLKTAVKILIGKLGNLNNQDICDIAASFQKTIIDILLLKFKYAISDFTKYHTNNIADNLSDEFKTNIVVAGGVASNNYLRKNLQNKFKIENCNWIFPDINLCTDNAAMIAYAGLERFNAGLIDNINFKPKSRWNLEELCYDYATR